MLIVIIVTGIIVLELFFEKVVVILRTGNNYLNLKLYFELCQNLFDLKDVTMLS